MRYTIEGFSQEKALNFKKQIEDDGKFKTIKIDCTDLVILRWFVDFFPNMKKMLVDGKEYAWLSHRKMQEDLPILDISKRSCIDRMQKLVEFEILEYKCLKEGGTYSLYRFGRNYGSLISSRVDGVRSNVGGVRSNNTPVYSQPYTPVYSQPYTIDSILNNNIDNNDNNLFISKDINKPLSSLSPQKRGKSTKNSHSFLAIEYIIAEYDFSDEEKEMLMQFFGDKLSRKEYIAENQVRFTCNDLAKVNSTVRKEAIKKAITGGWKGIYVDAVKPEEKKSYRLSPDAIKKYVPPKDGETFEF